MFKNHSSEPGPIGRPVRQARAGGRYEIAPLLTHTYMGEEKRKRCVRDVAHTGLTLSAACIRSSTSPGCGPRARARPPPSNLANRSVLTSCCCGAVEDCGAVQCA